MHVGAQGNGNRAPQRVGAMLLAKRDQSAHLTRCLFWVIGAKKDPVRQHAQRPADGGNRLAHGLGREPRRRPMLGRAVFVEGDVRTQHAGLRPAARMGRGALTLVENADQAGGGMHIDRLADEPEWRRIGHAIDADMIVGAELETLPAADCKGLAGQRSQLGLCRVDGARRPGQCRSRNAAPTPDRTGSAPDRRNWRG